MYIYKISFLFIVATLMVIILIVNAGCPGCPQELSGEKIAQAKNSLEDSLKKLAAGDGPFYQLLEINSATVQVVSGVLYKINANLSDGENKVKVCDIEIWQQPWLENGTQVTFNCPGEEKVSKKHN